MEASHCGQPSTSYAHLEPRAQLSQRAARRPRLPPPRCAGGEPPAGLTRRQQLALLTITTGLLPLNAAQAAGPAPEPAPVSRVLSEPPSVSLPNYALAGPFEPVRLPQLEHTCTTCAAPAESCRMKIQAWVPKGGGHIGLPKPYPLAVFTSGFLLAGAQYASYAERLTSWGYCCITYDLTQQALDPLTDVVCVALLRDLLDWARTSAPLGALCDTHAVLLAGHSRGAKVSALAAAQDDRVRALFLIDPVDNTPYAPLGPGFPSAAAALAAPRPGRAPLPVAVVGSELGADCAPEGANYSRFYDAAQAPALEAVVRGAGHLQFLDSRGGNAMDLVCAAGRTPDAAVAELTRALLVVWAETMVRGPPPAAAAAGGGSGGGDGALRCGLDGSGSLVAGLASFDSLQALYATEAALRRGEGVAPLEVTTRLKNFVLA